MFIALAQVLPVYKNFNANITYSIPFANNTQYGQVWQLGDNTQQRFEWYNQKKTIDITINHDFSADKATYHYLRTEAQKESCYYYLGSEYADFIPVDDGTWEYIDTVYVANVQAKHYRTRGEYVPKDPQNSQSIEVRSYEQNFYVRLSDSMPMRWTMQSKSNFGSHYDSYNIEYSSFVNNTNIPASTWTIPTVINGKPIDKECNAQPEDPEDPAGPTMAFVLNNAFAPKRTEPNGVVAKNIELLKKIRANKRHTFTVAANRFIDKDTKAVLKHLTGRKSANKRNDQYLADTTLPQQLDWRVSGVTGMVKDQVFCGSCWSFSAVATLESRINTQKYQLGLTNDPFVRLSEQQIVDCFWRFTGSADTQSCGCEGGDENAVLAEWAVNKTSAFFTEHDYPYIGQNDFCKEGNVEDEILPQDLGYKVTGYHTVPANNIIEMKKALQSGPVSVGISVTESFLYYAGGIYNDPACSSDPDTISHAVNLVGYGMTDDFRQYWILKNSWSPLWGLDGYIYLDMQGNICSVLSIGAYVDVQKTN